MNPENLLIIADSERNADMLFATGYYHPEPFIFLRLRGRRYAVLGDLIIRHARQNAAVDRILSLSRYRRECETVGIKDPGLGHIAARVLREFGTKRIVVPGRLPLEYAKQLRSQNIKLRIRAGWAFPEREFKSSAQVRMISAALGMAEVGMAEGVHALRRSKIGRDGQLLLNGHPLTSERLRAIIESAILHAGGIAAHSIVACGNQGCDPSERGYGPLRANRPTVLNVFPRSARTGYYGVIARTVVRGRATETVRRMFHTVQRGQELAFSQLRPGNRCEKIHQAVTELFHDEGYESSRRNGCPCGFCHETGHGLGLELREAPQMNLEASCKLKPGHVVAIAPGLYYPGIGGVRLEDVGLVTLRGARNLTQFEKVIEV